MHQPSNPRAPSTTTLVGPFAPSVPALRGGDGTALTCGIEKAIECGAMAEALHGMRVEIGKLGDDAGRLPVTAATDFAIEICEKLTGSHDTWMTDRYGERSANAPVDIWSLGVVLYRALGGESSVRTDIPLGLQSVVFRCLKTGGAGVIPDARSLAIALAPYASRSGQLRARRLQHRDGAHRSPSMGTVRTLPPASSPAREPPAQVPARARPLPFRTWLAWVAASLSVVGIAIGVASHAFPASPAPLAQVQTVTVPLGVANRMPDVAPSAAERVAPLPAPTASEHVYQPEELPLAREIPSAATAKAPHAKPSRSRSKRAPDRIGPDVYGF
jgi:hypothetical protein